jgi:hypothetical protein
MHYGSSKEEASSEEEARAQDRRGEEDDREEDGHRPSQDRCSQEVAGEARGLRLPRLPIAEWARRDVSNFGLIPNP